MQKEKIQIQVNVNVCVGQKTVFLHWNTADHSLFVPIFVPSMLKALRGGSAHRVNGHKWKNFVFFAATAVNDDDEDDNTVLAEAASLPT